MKYWILLYNLVQKIPAGKVATYSQLARLAGIKNPRFVGSLLHKNPDPKNIPCHRVVNIKGLVAKNFAFGGAESQREKLKAEGVEVSNKGKVDLVTYLWNGVY